MARQSSRLSLERVAKEYEQAWSRLKILEYPRVEALLGLLHSFELMIKAAEQSPQILDVPKFVLGLKGLNLLVPHVVSCCPDQIITHNELKKLGFRKAGSLPGCHAAAIDALTFGTMYGFFQDFAKSESVSWRLWDEYSAEISVTNDLLFKQETMAALVWEEIDIRPLPILEALITSPQDNAVSAAEEILNWQTGSFPLEDRWEVGTYTVGDWKRVLQNLIARALLVRMKAPRMTLPVMAGDSEKLTLDIAHKVTLPKKRVRDILHDLSFDAQEEKANLAQTPFIVVGSFLVGSPSLLLLRRSDWLLLKQWAKRHLTTFNRSHKLIANRIHEELAKAFRERGCEAWSDVGYTSAVDSKRRDIDVLVRDSAENWLVIQVKAFLPPSPASESLAARSKECVDGLDQIADARNTILKAPERVLAGRVKRTNGKYSVRSCDGLLVTTHTYGVPPDVEFPSVEYVVLRHALRKLSSSVSIPQLISVAAGVQRPLQDAPISWQVFWNSGFVLSFPYVKQIHPRTVWFDKALRGPLFHAVRIIHLIRRRLIGV